VELQECLEKRRSVRSFSDEPVPDEIIEEAIYMANLAPSVGNQQARDFIVVRNRATIEKLVTFAHGQSFIGQASVIIVCCANHDRIITYGPRGRDLYAIQDVAASVENMLLYLTSQDYAGCWIGVFDEDKVSEALSLPSHVRPEVMLPIGKAATEGRHPQRLTTGAIMHREQW
jgi:nitroreductase